MFDEISRELLSEKIAQRIRSAVMSGQLKPGERLVEGTLASQMSVSRAPVREALRILETEGLVTVFPNRGTFVTTFSTADIFELYSLRTVLEQLAARLAAQHATAADTAELLEAADEMYRASLARDVGRIVELELKFHGTIWRAARHRRLSDLLHQMFAQVQLCLVIDNQVDPDLPSAALDHRAIAEALGVGDGERAATLIDNQIARSRDILVQLFAEPSGDGRSRAGVS